MSFYSQRKMKSVTEKEEERGGRRRGGSYEVQDGEKGEKEEEKQQ